MKKKTLKGKREFKAVKRLKKYTFLKFKSLFCVQSMSQNFSLVMSNNQTYSNL